MIATRSDPILALHEARLAGKVREIRADELAFDEDETRRFLAANDIAVSPEQAYALWSTPKGGRLDSGCLRRRCLTARTDEAFPTLLQGDTAVGSYLMGQALAYTPDDLREFLLQTSVSEFLDAELADKLTGRSDSALLLERARVQPGFLNRQSEGRWPYRYHPMFRALLLAELMGVAWARSGGCPPWRLNGLPAMASTLAPHRWLCRVSPGRCLPNRFWRARVSPSRPATGAGCDMPWRACPLPTSKQI